MFKLPAVVTAAAVLDLLQRGPRPMAISTMAFSIPEATARSGILQGLPMIGIRSVDAKPFFLEEPGSSFPFGLLLPLISP